MVFANLSSNEKDAFFSLLDEYFASRPDVFGNAASGGSGDGNGAPSLQLNPAVGRAAASAIHSAFSAQSAQSTGSDSASSEPAWKRASSTSPQPTGMGLQPSLGRVAAAASLFKNNPPPAPAAGPPRPPPRRVSSTASPPQEHEAPPSSPPPPAPRAIGSASKLVTQKKFGDVDVTSGKNAFLSIRHGTANKTAVPPPVAPPPAPALAHVKNNFAPPPVRRVSSTASTQSEAKSAPPPPPPPRPAQPSPEPEGEWAEALYEYTSDDPGDLPLTEGQQILIVEKTSDEWWTGEHDGRRGLVPASYVKLL